MTPQKWKTVRIFISSTFRDMHAERDYLVRFVFPELKEKCRKKRVNLIDVDLRWGVTEADAQDGKALDVCLDEIDSCRPYFLGLLGHRYGWVPPGEEHSITAQEIYHGVLHTDVPHQVVDLRQIIEGKLEGKALTNEQVNCLVRCYQWDPDKGKYLLKDDATDDGLQIIRSVFGQYSAYQRDRSFFFFRWEGLTKKLADTNVADFFEAEKANQDKLVSLKQEIIDAGLPWFEYDDIESFGNKVGETLWHRIEAELGELVEKEKDWLEEEAEFHELFMADRTRRFVGRRDVLDRMRAFCEGTGEPSLMVVTGEPGCGKSALMARFTEEVTHDHPGWLIIPHFVGASPTSTNLRQTLRRFCSDLNQITKSPEEVPEDIKELLQVFPSLLEKTSEQKRLLIAIDAANQFEKADNAHDMRWLPQELPSNVRFVISTLGGDAYNALLARRVKPAVEEITGLNEIEIRELVGDYLEEIRHEFPNPRVEKDFFEKVKDGNPLYMLVALEELRVFGEFDRLGERVGKLPDNVPALFDQVLERVESDFNHALVRDCMSFIACGRQGMTAEELQTLLKAHAPQIDPDAEPDRLPDMIWARLYRAFGPYLFERSGVIDFFHGQFKEAVGKRYLQDESERNETHKRIADYFEGRWQEPYHRAVQELPHQRTKAQDWDGVERVLTDLFFIEAKCAAGMTYDLIADYNTALNGLPEAQEIRRKEEEHKRRVRQYTEDLIAFARGEIENLDIIPSVEPWSEEKARKETERIINSPTCLDRIRAFSQFVNSESHRLVKYGNMPNFGLNQAYNSARSGPVVAQAESVINSGMDGILILRARRSCSKYSAYPANLKTLQGHTSWVASVSVTPDGRLAVSGSQDETVRVWDIETGKCIKTLEGHRRVVTSVSVTPDGKRALSAGGGDKKLRVWDIETGECIKSLEGHASWVKTVSVTPDGRLAVSGGNDRALRVWDIGTGECIKSLEGHTAPVNGVSVTSDGKRAVSVGRDETVRVWDIETGKCIKSLEGHTTWVNSVSVTPDGKRAVSVGRDKTLRVWDIETGQCIKSLDGHRLRINSVSVTSDGKRAVSVGRDKTLRVWDIETGQCTKTLEGHTDWVESVSVTPDGRLAVSGSQDKTVRVWDIETGQCIKILEDDLAGSLTVTPDGKMAVSASSDETVRVWDIETGQCINSLEGHRRVVTSVSVTPDGRLAVSGSQDKTVRVWDIETGQCIKILEDDLAGSLTVTPDG
ncbi:MAG: DUF4062 domain-containing protein, partial [Thermodesulfobacteriota bacterium]|nr:DUF4062 domain-containing protein [Thermodesulfobacteriota bacterium]